MFQLIFLATLTTLAFARGGLLGGDPKTWSPKHNETDKCEVCKNTFRNICSIVPETAEDICIELINVYPPHVICQDLCLKITWDNV